MNGFFDSLGKPPQSLSLFQVRALAGEIYKDAVSEIDQDDAIAEEVEAFRDDLQEGVTHYVGEGSSQEVAELQAAIDMPDQRTLMAWGLKHGDPIYSREQLLKMFFGPSLDLKLAEHQLSVDAATRVKLLHASEKMGQDFIDTAGRRLKRWD